MAANILTAQITVRGFRPLMWHAYKPEMMALEKKEKRGKPGYDPEEWADAVLADETGHLYVKHTYLFGALRNAGKFSDAPKGRGSLMTAVASTIQVSSLNGSEIIYLRDLYMPDPITTDPNEPVYLDIRGVVVNRAKHVRSRVTAAAGWELDFLLHWDAVNSNISRNTMEKIVRDAGTLVGIGDGRQIGYGRFDVVSFEVV